MAETSKSGLKAIDLIIRARIILMSKSAFFGTLAMKLKFVETKDVPTQGVSADFQLIYNPDWIDTKSVEDAVFDLAHEIMHLVQRVHDRFPKGGIFPIWNQAADWVVDTALTDAGKLKRSWRSLKMVDADAIEKVHELKITERVYRWLLKPENQPDNVKNCQACQDIINGTGPPSDSGGGNQPSSGNPKGESLSSWSSGGHTCGHGTCGVTHEPLAGTTLAKVQHNIAYANQISKGKGEQLGTVLDDYVLRILQPSVDWRVYLRNCLTSTFRGRYTFSRQHRRVLDESLAFPSRSREPGGIVAILDCSGSMANYLPKLMAELYGLCTQSGCEKLYVIQHDVLVYNAGMYDAKGILNLKPTFGGTSHQDAFSVVEGKHTTYSIPFKPQLVVCFTDLETSFPKGCSTPTIWLSPVAHDVPFGKYIKLEMEESNA